MGSDETETRNNASVVPDPEHAQRQRFIGERGRSPRTEIQRERTGATGSDGYTNTGFREHTIVSGFPPYEPTP